MTHFQLKFINRTVCLGLARLKSMTLDVNSVLKPEAPVLVDDIPEMAADAAE